MNKNNIFIHKTAEVEQGAVVGAGTKIWNWTHVMPNAQIGENCNIGQNVFIGKVRIGNGVKIQNNVSVYDSVELEDDVFCGPSCVFTNVMNPRSNIERKNEYKTTIVKKGSTIGANATIICGITINEFSFIGAASLVRSETKRYSLNVGVPSKQIGWMTIFGEKMFFENNEFYSKLENKKYILINEEVFREDELL